jgi:hypothetical protein
MVSIVSLWLPILLSAAAVFIISSLIHMFLGYHKKDFQKIPSEDQVMNDLRKSNIPPGEYMMPFCSDNKERQSEAYKDKINKGPIALMTVLPAGQMGMASSMIWWFVYCVIVGIFAAYISGHALVPGTNYLSVFRFAGCTAFAAYSLALMQNSIWYKRKWSTTIKFMFDGLIYALLTAGFFGWLWPAV